LAETAIAEMKLVGVAIGIVPRDQPGKIGVIGFPSWMWVANPTPETAGPVTATATAGGYSVTATATLSKVVWDMGDGDTVSCRGSDALGTEWTSAKGKTESPTCGHTYTKQGTYTVTATSFWDVNWGGIGQTGTIKVNVSSSTQIKMGELQVIVK
jgi:hypothetical protein